jgi:hypothetical protein
VREVCAHETQGVAERLCQRSCVTVPSEGHSRSRPLFDTRVLPAKGHFLAARARAKDLDRSFRPGDGNTSRHDTGNGADGRSLDTVGPCHGPSSAGKIAGAASRHEPGAAVAVPGLAYRCIPLLAPMYAEFTEGFDTTDLREANALLEALGGSA